MMGLLDWLFGPPPPPAPMLEAPGRFNMDVVGESRYQANLERLNGGRTEESADRLVEALLIPEDGNPHDDQAVRVDVKGKTVGYLGRDDAREYRGRIAAAGRPGLVHRCPAKIVGGWDRGEEDRGHFGVRLDLPTAYTDRQAAKSKRASKKS